MIEGTGPYRSYTVRSVVASNTAWGVTTPETTASTLRGVRQGTDNRGRVFIKYPVLNYYFNSLKRCN